MLSTVQPLAKPVDLAHAQRMEQAEIAGDITEPLRSLGRDPQLIAPESRQDGSELAFTERMSVGVFGRHIRVSIGGGTWFTSCEPIIGGWPD
jgi:hypothetical protein